MRPLSVIKNVRSPLSLIAAGSVIAALSASALPLIHIWQMPSGPRAEDTVQLLQTGQGNFPIVVDLKDGISDSKIKNLSKKYGITLRPNSDEAKDDGLMVATVPANIDVSSLLSRLKHDPDVEAAEPELVYSIPEDPLSNNGASQVEMPVVDAEIRQESINNTASIHVEVLTVQGETLIRRTVVNSLENNGIEMTQQVETAPVTLEVNEGSGVTPGCTVSEAPEAPTNVSTAINYQYANIMDSEAPRNPAALNEDAPLFAMKPNDPRYNEQWNFQMIGMESAWKRTQGKDVVVAVIDTGVAGGEVKKGKPCRDFGQTTFVKGYDFVNKSADAFDDHGHGTHVAGTIAESTDNNEGVAGIAFKAKIMPLKVLSASGSGSSADIADAIRFAADNGANVINMSLGSAFPSDVIHKAVKYARKKGVVIVCAAGNSFGGKVGYPAAYPECIAVSAVGPNGNIAKYSSYGKEVAISAPGGDMVDSGNPADGILQNTNFPESQGGKGDDYYAFQGTSMASPHVAGVAALLVSQGINDPAQIREILEQTAQPKSDKTKYGAGILSAVQATAKAEALGSVKLRHLLLVGLGFLLFSVGPRRNWRLRMAMFGALTAGFFGPDLASRIFGWDTAWNLLTFSALPALALYAILPKGPGVKVAGMMGLGLAVNLWANWHNGTIPFSAAAFGDAALPWTMTNMVAALGVGAIAALKAYRATR